MVQDSPQPGEPFRFGSAAKLGQTAMRIEQGLLHEIRGVDFGSQPTPDFGAGHDRQIIPARGKQSLACLGVAPAGVFEPLHE